MPTRLTTRMMRRSVLSGEGKEGSIAECRMAISDRNVFARSAAANVFPSRPRNSTPIGEYDRAVRIPAKFLRHLVLRGTILWVLARLAVLAIGAAAAVNRVPGAEQTVAPGAIMSFWGVVITAALVLVDLQRRKELMLLHNLGVTTQHATLVGTTPAVTLEVLLTALR